MKKSLYFLTALGLASAAHAASADQCAPVPPVPCYSVDDCEPTFCLGPQQVNPAVRPCTCDGDIVLTIAAFYWNAHQDGMEYAISNCVAPPATLSTQADTFPLNNLIDAKYERPDYSWDFGFKLGLGYNSNHDGWDFGVLWTWFRDSANDKVEAEPSDNQVLLPLWSAFAPISGGVLFASDIETHWRVELNLIDIDLGREMWMSKYLTFRPFVGIRIAYLNQDYDLDHSGGSFGPILVNGDTRQQAQISKVRMDNDFRGAGLRGGFDTVWNFGRGWAFVGNLGADIVYGKFTVKAVEDLDEKTGLRNKRDVLETRESFWASRGMLDMFLGLQWETLFSECRYCFTFNIGWEHHMFFHQNQMWRVNRIGDTSQTAGLPNNTGENVFHQRRGDFTTQGWTLTLKFGF